MTAQIASVIGSKSDRVEAPSSPGESRLLLRPVGILDAAVAGRSIIQDFRAFSDSLEWELGLRYYQSMGSGAFLHDATPIPYAVNNDGNLAAAAAKLMFESLCGSEGDDDPDAEILVLEIGVPFPKILAASMPEMTGV